LGWARSQDKGIVAHPEKIRIDEIIKETTVLMKNSVEAKQITLTHDLPSGEIAFFDPQMIRLVLRNLLSNAVKFTPLKGTIAVNLSSNKNQVEVTISDSGVGMDHETLVKVFDAKYHYTTIGTMDERGSGLGLKLAQEFIAINGGRLWAESTPAIGTTVHFTLPKGPVLPA
ncbi:MAG TPA: HAMP domain-containing sensor histidine kinase, partial [Williamwhitmania sp.]|nr:HAMP domain-containing sensor histidine kinase [Williamwhitmania sp.]